MASPVSPVADALRATLELFETGVALMRQNLRRTHPNADDEEIEGLLGAWLHERPGATFGDCDGRPVDVSARLG
jgi:hypothetical protein